MNEGRLIKKPVMDTMGRDLGFVTDVEIILPDEAFLIIEKGVKLVTPLETPPRDLMGVPPPYEVAAPPQIEDLDNVIRIPVSKIVSVKDRVVISA